MSFPFTVPLTAKEIRTPTSTQRAPLGTRGMTSDGRVFRYAKAGATALVKAHLCQSEVASTTYQNATCSLISTAFFTELGTTYVPAGTTYLHMSSTMGTSTTTVVKDFFKEGWVWCSGTSTAGGQLMKIKTHSVGVSGSTGYCSTGGQVFVEFEAGHALSEPIDSAMEVSLTKNEYDDVIVNAATSSAEIVGVPVCDVSANYYFWIQTWGPCVVTSEGEAISGNKPIWPSTQTAGCIQGATGSTDLTGTDLINGFCVGRTIQSSGATVVLEANTNLLVHLTIAP